MTGVHAAGAESDRTRWLILALLFACRTAMGFQFQTLGSVSESLVAQLGFSYTEIGTLIGLFMLPGLVLSLPAGYLGRYLPDRTLVALGFASLAVGGTIAALAQGFGLLALGRIAAGAGFVISTIYLTKMVADWFAGKKLATAMSVLVMSWPFGIAMGQIAHVWVDAHFDWRVAFLVASVYCAAGALAVFLLYRPPAHARQAQAAGPIGLPRQELVLTLLAAAAWGLFNGGYIVYLSFAPQVLIAGGYEATRAAAVVSIASWVLILSGAVFGQLADRSGKPDRFLYAGTAVAVLVMLSLPQASLAVGLSLLFGLIGVAPAGIIMALTGEAMAPERRAFGMGVFMTCYFVLQTAAPPIAGWLFDRTGDPYGPIVFGACLFAGAALANWAFRRAQKVIAAR